MSKKKTNDPKAKSTRFPYSILWEEFAPLREKLPAARVDREIFQARFFASRSLGGPPHLTLSLAQLETVIQPLNLATENQVELADRLLLLAGRYLAPQHRKLLGTSPAQTQKNLRTLARAAANFSAAVDRLPVEVQLVLTALRAFVPDARNHQAEFLFEQLADDSGDLARTAVFVVDEMPSKAQGSSIDVLLQRWIAGAVSAIESVTGQSIEVRQADSAGRNPRLLGTTGAALLAYCRLVSPKISNRTIVRLILAERSVADVSR